MATPPEACLSSYLYVVQCLRALPPETWRWIRRQTVQIGWSLELQWSPSILHPSSAMSSPTPNTRDPASEHDIPMLKTFNTDIAVAGTKNAFDTLIAHLRANTPEGQQGESCASYKLPPVRRVSSCHSDAPATTAGRSLPMRDVPSCGA